PLLSCPLLLAPPPPTHTLFPYTTLFRSRAWYGTLKPPAPREFALTEFFEDSLEPDMPSLSKDVVQRLEGLAQSNDLDERALALASLHFARGEDPWVRRFLAGEIAHLDSLDDVVRKRWSIALGFVADRYR